MADRPFVGAESNYDYGGSRLDKYCDRCGLLPAWCSCPPLTAEEQRGAHVTVTVNGQPIEPVDSIECPEDTGVILGEQGTMEMRVASSTVPGVPAVAPEPRRYFGQWTNHDDMAADWCGIGSTKREELPDDAHVLFAAYDIDGYEGGALVVFRDDEGGLYEANGSHCSCMGLEDQWKPERTTPAALAIRDVWPPSADATSALHELAARLIAQAKL